MQNNNFDYLITNTNIDHCKIINNNDILINSII